MEHTKELLSVPLSSLVPSPHNVRRHTAGQVEELAADRRAGTAAQPSQSEAYMTSKALRLGVALAVLVTSAYWYWSPLLAIRQMQSAAKAGDADSFSEHVDYARLRESLKGQFSGMLPANMPSQSGDDRGMAKAGAALGMLLGTSLVNQFVDATVRPEVVMRAMQEGQLMPRKSAGSAAPEAADAGSLARQKAEWSDEHKGFDKYIAYARKAGEPEDKRCSQSPGPRCLEEFGGER